MSGRRHRARMHPTPTAWLHLEPLPPCVAHAARHTLPRPRTEPPSILRPQALGLLKVRTFVACVVGRYRISLAPSMGGVEQVKSKIKGDLVMSFGGGLNLTFRDRMMPQA